MALMRIDAQWNGLRSKEKAETALMRHALICFGNESIETEPQRH
jgi:hypothetical protein